VLSPSGSAISRPTRRVDGSAGLSEAVQMCATQTPFLADAGQLCGRVRSHI
jgi:hypothetical protein